MKIILNVFLGVLIIIYPLIVYLGISNNELGALALGVFIVGGLRIFLFIKTSNKEKLKEQWSSIIIFFPLLLLPVIAYLNSSPDFYRIQPVWVSATLGIVFSLSLFKGRPIVERLARLKDGDLPEKAIVYCRKVTKVWIVFFCFKWKCWVVYCLTFESRYLDIL